MTPAQLRKLAGRWPGVNEDVKWGADLCLQVDDKMFLVTGMKGGAFTIKVDGERFLELTDRPGIEPAPHLARAQWVKVEPGALEPAARDALIRRSYELIREKLSKKRQRELAD